MTKEELKQRLIELLEKHEDMINATEDDCDWGIESRDFPKVVDHLIANGVTIRERGEWVKYPHNSGIYCSVCHGKARYKDINKPFCPHCGADMRGDSK